MPGACAGGSDRPSRQGEQSVEPMWTGLSVRRLAFMLLEAGVNVLKLAGYSGTSHVAHEVDEDGGHEGRTRTHPSNYMRGTLPVSSIGGGASGGSSAFGRLAAKTSQLAGKGTTFLLATAVVVLWAATGPISPQFHGLHRGCIRRST
jgi:hypothetical protein